MTGFTEVTNVDCRARPRPWVSTRVASHGPVPGCETAGEGESQGRKKWGEKKPIHLDESGSQVGANVSGQLRGEKKKNNTQN